MTTISCPNCGSVNNFIKKGYNSTGNKRRLRCKTCGEYVYVAIEDYPDFDWDFVALNKIPEPVDDIRESNESLEDTECEDSFEFEDEDEDDEDTFSGYDYDDGSENESDNVSEGSIGFPEPDKCVARSICVNNGGIITHFGTEADVYALGSKFGGSVEKSNGVYYINHKTGTKG